MTHSAVPDLSVSASRAGQQPAQQPALSRQAAEFLVELSISLHKHAMYPANHPHAQSSAARLAAKTAALLQEQPHIVFGIGREQIVVDGVATDARNNLFRELAERLHRHRLATLRLDRGVSASDLDALVGILGSDPLRSSLPGGIFAEASSLQHVRLQAIEYERIVLEETEPGSDTGLPPARHQDLWTDLARLAAESSPGLLNDFEAEPAILARSIDFGSIDPRYSRGMLGRLTHLMEEIAERNDPRDEALQARISKLLTTLRPGTLVKLLSAGENDDARRRFVKATSGALGTEAVMSVLEAVATTRNQQISHHLFRLLRKLGTIDLGAPVETRAVADNALRQNVNRLLEDWRLEDPNPEQYTAALDRMAFTTPIQGGRAEECDPITLIQAAIEGSISGPRIEIATDAALGAGLLDVLIGVLEGAPDEQRVEAIWRRVATPRRLKDALERGGLGSSITVALIKHLGGRAVDPLLDLLATGEDRATRATALRLLAGLGEPSSRRAIALLPDSPWYVQRNLIVLLGRIGSWPAELRPEPYVEHADARVRREALKLLLESPGRRDAALLVAMRDSDTSIRALGLSAALEECPGAVLPIVQRLAVDPECPAELRTLAIKVVARSGNPEVVDVLVTLALARRLRFLRRIAPKAPEVVAAVAGLAAHWSEDTRAADVLARARRHRDLDVRTAAGVTS